ncbi:MAG: GNAT family N-acetyltransferase [archaeon]|nr:MAG: GNAT family N-acetyltransferase [archaeon]
MKKENKLKVKLKYLEKKSIEPEQLFSLHRSVRWTTNKNKQKQKKIIYKEYKNSQIVVSAWNGKELVGVIRALTERVKNGMIFGLVVKQKYRSLGVGTKLIKKCIKKYPKIRWYLRSENSKTDKFYKRRGFKKIKRGFIWILDTKK